MEYKKIENLVYKNNLIDKNSFKNKADYMFKLDTMLIENLKKCIDKKVPIEMNEDDLAKIYKIYLKLVKKHYNIDSSFINDLINISQNKLDYFAIIENITE